MTAKLLKITKSRPKKKIACSIRITCSQTGEGGEMDVEMSYEGDSCLAAYLLEDAQRVISGHIEEEALPAPRRRSLRA